MPRKRSSHRSRTRVISRNANPRLRSVLSSNRYYKFPDLTLTQDYRRFFPYAVDNVSRQLNSTRSKIRTTSPRVRVFNSTRPVNSMLGTSFLAPRRVIICVRRNIRKQVLHAYRKTGKGGQRRPIRTAYSQISCRG